MSDERGTLAIALNAADRFVDDESEILAVEELFAVLHEHAQQRDIRHDARWAIISTAGRFPTKRERRRRMRSRLKNGGRPWV